jgi:hypothetical protein
MSVTAQTPYKKYTAAPAATLFTTDFRLLLASDLVVKVNSAVVTTGFTVSGIGAASADVTFGTPMVGGESIELQRSVPKTRSSDFQQLGDFQAPVINADLDRIVMMLQDSQFLNALALTLAAGSTASTVVPEPVANALLGWNAAGNALQNYAGGASAPVSLAMAPVVAGATLAAARAAMGVSDVSSLNLLAAINGGQIAGFRNRIHNGGFQVDQRNAYAAQTITAGAALSYTADRWYAYCTGANVTGQVVAGSAQAQRRYRFTGAASVTAIGLGTRLEARDTYDLNNQVVTIAADLANSLLTTVTWTLSRATTTDDTFGTLAAPTVTQIATGTFTVNSTVSRYSAQVSVPAAATTGLQLVFSVGAQTSGTWTIGNVQLEQGTDASAFEIRPYATEFALACRYYYRWVTPSFAFIGLLQASTTTQALGSIRLPVELRAVPAITFSGPSAFYVSDAAAGGRTVTNILALTSSSLDVSLQAVVASGLVAGNAAYLQASGLIPAWIAASADL